MLCGIQEEEINDIERVQRVACKVILKDRYEDYEQALKSLNLKKKTYVRDLPRSVSS